jgi:hypothetical protein
MGCFCLIGHWALGAKVAIARRRGLIDAPVARALSVLRKLCNAFAHSTESAALADPAHNTRLAEIYAEARTNPLWTPLETMLTAQPPTANGQLEPALRGYVHLLDGAGQLLRVLSAPPGLRQPAFGVHPQPMEWWPDLLWQEPEEPPPGSTSRSRPSSVNTPPFAPPLCRACGDALLGTRGITSRIKLPDLVQRIGPVKPGI